QWAPSGSVR
ncbi:uncharacterized protein RMCC_0046, partial [Mycolicibacterium canariasense]